MLGTSHKTRVLMLLENSTYPQDDRVRREAETLVSAGYEVSVICPARSGQKLREAINNVFVQRYPAPPQGKGFVGYVTEYGYAMAASSAISLLLFFQRGFDVIHAANPPDTFAFIAAFYKLFGKRFVHDHHDLAPEMYLARFDGKGNQLVYHSLVALEKFSCRIADRVIATNNSYKAVEIARAGIAPERITVVRNGPDLNRFKGLPSLPSEPTMSRTVLGYVGVTGYQDGVDYLLRAIHHLRFTLGKTDFLCRIIGSGDALPWLKSITRALNITEHVQFTGWVEHDEVARQLAGADLCLAPEPSNAYTDRSTTIKLMEYMALEKPIVAFDLPEHRVTADGAALYVRPNDELAFARAIVELMEDPSRRRAMARFGRQRVESHLAWSHSAPKLLEVYQELSEMRHGAASRKKFGSWFRKRRIAYLIRRSCALVQRYRINSRKAKERVRECVHFFRERQCSPTLPTPGRVVERHPGFCREIQALGAELAVHGYDHVDFLNLSDREANQQMVRATSAFQSASIQFSGFRCPYLSYDDRVLNILPENIFDYSSNKAISWKFVLKDLNAIQTSVFENLECFYRPDASDRVLSMPRLVDNIVEIPVSLPDDLQLYDGLKLRAGQLARPWIDILRQTHRTGQLFVLMFHPELFNDCRPAFEILLSEAARLTPPVWMAPLREISGWWHEKAKFTIDVRQCNGSLELQFQCSERATILLRNLLADAPTRPWYDNYRILESRTLTNLPAHPPFVGLPVTSSKKLRAFLEQQGFIVDQSESGPRCTLYIDDETLVRLDNEVKLIEHIESSPAPLVRFWPWPNRNKSALAITGDLDALSLTDYTGRIFH